MRKKSIIALLLVAVIAVVGVLVAREVFARETTTFRFVSVERGDVASTVSATGALSAVKTVSVGTQVSGQVAELLVDFNDQVKKGQLLARIDPTLQMQAVVDAQANLDKSQAQLLDSQRGFARNRELAESGLIAKSEYQTSESSLSVAQASVKSARVALDRARQNLSYTSIYAPIDGVVVERNVDQGQTVAASLSAPQLFLIANNLSQMQILAQVGESDIAQIKEGQPVQFTVQAIQGQTFKGTVEQVRLQSKTTDNVVNYTVVVAVPNEQMKLLPGMTARVEFLTKSAENVLKVANAALRFKPATETATTTTAPRQPGQARRLSSTGMRSGTLYFVDNAGKVQMTGVRTGITDGTTTEVQGKDLTEGMKVIAGTTSSTQSSATSTSASPFQGTTTSQQRGARGPGGF